MQKLNIEQDTPEWHELRRNHIGASDAPVIMGDSPFKTPYQLFQEKTALPKTKKESKQSTGAMERGKALEPIARQMFVEETGIQVSPVVCKHDDIEWLLASLDGLSEDNQIALEIKCGNIKDHIGAVNKILPNKYRAQLQHQLYVLGLPYMYYGSYHSGNLVTLRVERNDEYIDNLLKKEEEFWGRVKRFDPPEMTEADLKIQKRQDSVWLEKVTRYQLLVEYEKEKEALRKELIEMCADNDVTEGGGIKIVRRYEAGRVNYGKIPELEGVNLDKYRGKSITKHVVGFI